MKRLSRIHFEEASWKLTCEIEAIQAVSEVESLGSGFSENGFPKILFERHIFHRLTKGKWDEKHPDLSNKKSGGYVGGVGEEDRLTRAAELDREAALKSCSWGLFQIMGFNYELCNFSSVQTFVNYACRGEPQQLDLFVRFIKNQPGLLVAIRKNDFKTFARLYNGPGYAKNSYDVKMKQAYQKLKGE